MGTDEFSNKYMMGKQPNIQTKRVSNILVLYIYFPFLWNILENAFGAPAIAQYCLYIVLGLIPLAISHNIDRIVSIFLIVFMLCIGVNCAVADYRYYVMIEGLQAFCGLMVPCICVTNTYFDLNTFIRNWHKIAYWNMPLVFLAVILLRANLVHYSIFTGICVPNVFILSYGIMQMKSKTSWETLFSIINIIVIAALGGRMAAVVCVAMLVLAYLFSSKISSVKKLCFCVLILMLAVYMLINLNEILIWISDLLDKYGIKSRSVTLLIEQLKSKEIYMTNRDVIYSLTMDYIKGRVGLPGGFGVALNITSGEYYYVHNLILQLLVLFGIPGTIGICLLLSYRFYVLRHSVDRNVFNLLVFMCISYFIIGMTGSSIFIHYLATIFIALFFFVRKENLYMEV
ncbi:MAG: O-antigen ligase family protein [Roseburia sp.]